MYAIKEGTKQSDVATAILCWLETDPKTEGITGIERIETSPLLISSSNGNLKFQDQKIALSNFIAFLEH